MPGHHASRDASRASSWNDLPGFATDRVSEAWPALRVGCRALLANARTAPTWRKPCEAAEAIDGRDETAVRAFLAAHFSPYAVAFPDGRRDGLVTGYYEPKLRGLARTHAALRACRCTRFRTICSSSTWPSCIRSLRIAACARASRGVASCRTGAGATSSAARRRSRTRRSRTSPIRSTRSSCRSRAPAASSSPMAASCASATPTRTAIRIARSRTC